MLSSFPEGRAVKIEEARAIAAMCWCGPTTSDKIFDPVLAEAFANQLMSIANAWRYSVPIPEEGCENPRERHVFKLMGLLKDG